ncbi:MAG: TetR/AcrR family transcriptional regulator [Oscillochloris sp.]|nr:TetR/AcrR family transcriptional regulator [Oscillochloris sp.]
MDRREEIIDAAVQLFQQKGYANTSMQDIAGAVGLLKGSLYYYLSSKEDLLYEIHERFMQVLSAKAAAREQTPNLSARQRLAGVITDLLEMIRDYRPYVVVFFHEHASVTGPRWSDIHARRKGYEQLVREIVQQGQREGVFRRDLDERIVTFGLFGMCNWSATWLQSGGTLSTEQIAQTFVSLLLDGLTAG